MKKPVQFLISLFLLFVSSFVAKTSNPPSSNWIVRHPFDQKVFIENKGQLSIPGKLQSKDILFGAQQDGLNYYFTANGIWIGHIVPVKRTLEEIEQLKLPANEQKLKAFEYKFTETYHQIEFVGANSSVEVTGNSKLRQFYNYKTSGVNIKATAYSKINYKNLYPGIDMEFYFPTDKQGFKYSFIVHPGADISQLKMQYPLNEGLQLTPNGNMTITSVFGDFTDHAPVASQKNSLKNIDCSFLLSNGLIHFKVGNYDKTQDLIIDPWTATPVFPNSVSDRSYDIDWDNAGNCYIYGGSGQYSAFPLYLIKYNSSGTQLWQTEIKDYYQQDYGTELYGDFVVDKKSQSIYVAQGANIVDGAKIIKLDQSGAQIDSSIGNTNMIAIWRIVYSTKYNELVGVGGSYPNPPAATAMYIDTNLTNDTVVYVNNPPDAYHYMWGVTLDNSGNAYMAISGQTLGSTAGNNLFKVPMPTLSPTAWEVNDGYGIQGISDPQYIAHNGGNGFNGISVSGTDLFTYDSYTLKKWNTANGALIKSLSINSNAPQYIYWSGLASDSCGNVFLGSLDTVKFYDNNLTLQSYFLAPDSIYDLNLGNNNLLYACGADFVTAFKLTPHLVNTNTNADADSTLNYKICLGNSIGLKAAGAITYAWSPAYGISATTGDNVLATPSTTTTYTVICSGSLTCLSAVKDTFNIIVTVDTFPLPHIIVSPSSATICYGKNTLLNASGVKTYKWSPITGLNTSNNDTVLASPIVSTIYTVKGIDSNGCYDIGYSTVTVDTLPKVSVFSNSFFICTGGFDTLYASGQPAYEWSPSIGLNSTSGSSVIASPDAYTVYTVSVIGNDGCSNSAQIAVYVEKSPAVFITPSSPSVCPGDSISLKAKGANFYKWSPTAGLDSISVDSVVASPTVSTTYTIVGTNRFGCSDTIKNSITVTFPKVVITPSSPHVCFGQTISLVASGANTFKWSPYIGLNDTIGDTIIANPIVTTTYTIIGNNGCLDTTKAIVTVDSLPKVMIPDSLPNACSGQGFSIIAIGAKTYQWNPSAGLNATTGDTVIATVTTATTYTVTGTDNNGCTATATVSISIVPSPNKPTITKSVTGDSLISSATQGNQWYLNDTLIAGATNQIYVVLDQLSGNYTVSVINPANGCTAISDPVVITGINQFSINNNQLLIYPNPFNNEFVIQINSPSADVKNWRLDITDVLGRLIYTNTAPGFKNSIDMSIESSGMYFITINTGTDKKVFPVIKQE